MAYHRVGNEVLSQEEYDEHVDGRWVFVLFLIGAIGSGVITNLYLVPLIPSIAEPYDKWIKVTVILMNSLIVGFIFVKVREIIKTVIFLALAGALVAGVIGAIASSV